MIGNVIGVKPVNFTNKETGEVIEGSRLYVIADDMDCFGKSCEQIWVGSGTPLEKKLSAYLDDPEKLLGLDVDFSFKSNSKKVAQFEIIEKPAKKAG